MREEELNNIDDIMEGMIEDIDIEDVEDVKEEDGDRPPVFDE